MPQNLTDGLSSPMQSLSEPIVTQIYVPIYSFNATVSYSIVALCFHMLSYVLVNIGSGSGLSPVL